MAKAMTKSQILAALAEKSGMSKKDVSSFMDTVIEMAYSEVKKSGEFTVPGLGQVTQESTCSLHG